MSKKHDVWSAWGTKFAFEITSGLECETALASLEEWQRLQKIGEPIAIIEREPFFLKKMPGHGWCLTNGFQGNPMWMIELDKNEGPMPNMENMRRILMGMMHVSKMKIRAHAAVAKSLRNYAIFGVTDPEKETRPVSRISKRGNLVPIRKK